MRLSEEFSELRVGSIVSDKYRLERVIGRGGMGVVFQAMHLQLNVCVALKVLVRDSDSPLAVGRFMREACATVRLQSEHVARVFDVGSLSSGVPYMVMEYLQGMNLQQLLKTRGRPSIQDAVTYITHACLAVEEAHGLGIIHRDIKPSNLFLCERRVGPPIVKVLDFGISKLLNEPAPAEVTSPTSLVGSPQYMSPERLRSSANCDPRVDIWALGAVLYELLAGAPAFRASTVPALLASIMTDAPRALHEVCPAPAALERVVMRCLEKEAAARYQSAVHLRQALVPWSGVPTAHTGIGFEPTLPSTPLRERLPKTTVMGGEAPGSIATTVPICKDRSTLEREMAMSAHEPTPRVPPRRWLGVGALFTVLTVTAGAFVTSGNWRSAPISPSASVKPGEPLQGAGAKVAEREPPTEITATVEPPLNVEPRAVATEAPPVLVSDLHDDKPLPTDRKRKINLSPTRAAANTPKPRATPAKPRTEGQDLFDDIK